MLRSPALIVLAILPVVALTVSLRSFATVPDSDSASIIIKPDRQFARDSYVHRPLSPDAEIDEKSDLWVADLLSQIKTHYGKPTVNFDQYSPPVYIVGADQPTVAVKAHRPHEPDWSFAPLQEAWDAVPLPDNFAPARGTDREAIIYQPSTGRYWEFWLLEKTGRKVRNSAGQMKPEWRAAWGGKIENLASNPGYYVTPPEGYRFGTAATGLALLGGLMTIDEQRSGVIEHALHFAIPEARAHVWTDPAQRTDGVRDDPDAIPQGATFRFPADLDLDALDMDPYARMLAKAVQRYGMVLRDTAGAVAFYAEKPKSTRGSHPYYGKDGILRCPRLFRWSCSASARLQGFPWEKLQALKTTPRSDD